jgi:hypothetical protein
LACGTSDFADEAVRHHTLQVSAALSYYFPLPDLFSHVSLTARIVP